MCWTSTPGRSRSWRRSGCFPARFMCSGAWPAARSCASAAGWWRRPGSATAWFSSASARWSGSFTSAVLYLVLPAEVGIGYWHFVAIYVLAYMAGYISHVPGGLGVFETVLLVLMPASAPTDAVAAGVVTYRAIYFLLPLCMALGMFGLYEAVRRRREE